MQQVKEDRVQRLENKLQMMIQKNKLLEREAERLEFQLKTQTDRAQCLQNQLKNQPLSIIYKSYRQQSMNDEVCTDQQIKYSNDQHRQIALLESKLSNQSYQLSYHINANQEKTLLLKEIQKRNLQMQKIIQELSFDNENLRFQIDSQRAKNKIFSQNLQIYTKKLKDEMNQRLNLIKQNKIQNKLIESLKNQKRLILNQISKNLSQLSSQNSQQYSQKNLRNDSQNRIVELKWIIKKQQQQLKERGEDLKRLQKYQKYQEPLNQVNLKHTLKHLKNQISKKSILIMEVAEKLNFANQTINRFNEIKISYENKINQLMATGIQEKYEEERRDCLRTKQKLAVVEDQNRQLRANQKIYYKNLSQILKENQSCHYNMFKIYGEGYRRIIDQQMLRTNERLKQRMAGQKWVTIQELIEVNHKLMKKLRLI